MSTHEALREALAAQLQTVVEHYDLLRKTAPHWDLSGSEPWDISRVTSLARAAVIRVAGRNSEYARQLEEIRDHTTLGGAGARLHHIIGVVKSLQEDLLAGHLATLSELLHAEVFADLVDMAQHLLDQGYKDPAAVVAGATLESHLRRLADNATISLFHDDDPERPKKAERLNADLAGKDVYGKLEQKNVTAWLDLRNKAAHGDFGTYESAEVGLMLAGIRGFLTKHAV